jgi:hypothetical protein
MRRSTAVLVCTSALVLFACGAEDQGEEVRASATTASTTSTTSTSKANTTAEPTTTAPSLEPPGSCSPAYPTMCIPAPPPDLDCPEVGEENFPVVPPDPHGFDRDGDGVACET